MNKNKIGILALTTTLLGTMLMSGVAFAQTAPQPGLGGPGRFGGMMGRGGAGRGPGVFGTVSAVNGTTLTVTSNGLGQNATPTTYTVIATGATVTKAGAAATLGNISVGDTVMIRGTVSGTTVTATAINDGVRGGGMMGRGEGQAPGVFGTVSAVNGNSITLASRMGPNGSAGTTYTVDATNAKVTKNNSASSVSAIAVGDTLMVQGTVSGTSVTATTIRDGMPQGGPGGRPEAPSIQGNGQPVVGGAVTSVNGTSLTIVNKSNITYTVDASSANIQKAGATSTISSVTVGDNLIVQGAVNGNSVVASSVIDSGSANMANAPPANGNMPGAPRRGGFGGMLDGIGGFFRHLFGF